MARDEAAVHGFMLSMQPNPKYFHGWSDEELATLDDAYGFGDTIASRLENQLGVEFDFAYNNFHNLDRAEEEWDSEAHQTVMRDVADHWCFVGWFKSVKDSDEPTLMVEDISDATGIAKNNIERPKSGRFSADNMKAYVGHYKETCVKHEYDPELVATIRGTDYVKVHQQRRLAWEKGKAAKAKKKSNDRGIWLKHKCAHGEITMDDIYADDFLYELFSAAKTKDQDEIKRACFNYAEHSHARELRAFKDGAFTQTNVMACGRTGEGKSTVFDLVIDFFDDELGWRAPKLAASKAIEEYKKAPSEVLRLNDVNPDFAPFNDALGILCPYETFNASARYVNTGEMCARYLSLTSNDLTDDFAFQSYLASENRLPAPGKLDAWIRRYDYIIYCMNSSIFGKNHWLITKPEVRDEWREISTLNPSRHKFGNTEYLFAQSQLYYVPVVPGLVSAPYVVFTIVRHTLMKNGYSFDEADAMAWHAVSYVGDKMRWLIEEGLIVDAIGDENFDMAEIGVFPEGEDIPAGIVIPAEILQRKEAARLATAVEEGVAIEQLDGLNNLRWVASECCRVWEYLDSDLSDEELAEQVIADVFYARRPYPELRKQQDIPRKYVLDWVARQGFSMAEAGKWLRSELSKDDCTVSVR